MAFNMDPKKCPMPTQDPNVRNKNFEEVALGYTPEMAMEEAGRCLGFAGMHAVCGECYVDLVAVHPAERRRGIGEQLVRQMIAWMEEQHGEFITLEVRVSNAPAIALYEKLGFLKTGESSRWYRVDSLLG